MSCGQNYHLISPDMVGFWCKVFPLSLSVMIRSGLMNTFSKVKSCALEQGDHATLHNADDRNVDIRATHRLDYILLYFWIIFLYFCMRCLLVHAGESSTFLHIPLPALTLSQTTGLQAGPRCLL